MYDAFNTIAQGLEAIMDEYFSVTCGPQFKNGCCYDAPETPLHGVGSLLINDEAAFTTGRLRLFHGPSHSGSSRSSSAWSAVGGAAVASAGLD